MSKLTKSKPKPKATEEHATAIISQIQLDPQEQSMSNENFDADVVVIGAGPGGYVAAIRAAQMGAKVICVEREYLGGTCLNWGCIPSKAMIAGVERLNHVKHAKDFGVVITGEIGFDFEVYSKRRDKIVQTQRGGIGMLFKKNNIRHIEGFAKFKDKYSIEVTKEGKTETVRAKNFILAMGSSAIHLKIPGLEGGREQGVWTSDDAVSAPHIPKSMLILGGGAVGTEFGYVFNGLGTKVTIVEMMPSLIPFMDADLGAELGKGLKKQGINVMTGTGLEKCEKSKDGWKCTIKTGGKEEVIEVEVVLLGVGRKANTDGMDLEKIGVKLHSKGVELVDDSLQTHCPNVYAIGDICGRIQLAHVASAEGIHAVSNILNGTIKQFDYKVVPNCVYTIPEIASVGLTQGQAEAAGHDVVVGKANFRIFGKAMAIGEVDGFVKIVAEKKYGEVLGVHMAGPHVTDMIAAGAAALKLEATVEIMCETIHAHPTLAEAMLEAYEDAMGHAIHKM
jgi:dihydrolipoamide dehydrogenase